MTTSQKVFRTIWRIDSVLILICMLVAVLFLGWALGEEIGRTFRAPEAKPVVVDNGPGGEQLVLGSSESIAGSTFLRLSLQEARKKVAEFSSGDYSGNTRNFLFVDPKAGSAKWLLPTNEQVLGPPTDIYDKEATEAKRVVVATYVLSRPKGSRGEGGKLLLFSPSGEKLNQGTEDVSSVHSAAFSGGDITILYERGGKLAVATFDLATLSKRKDQELSIQQAK